MTFLEFLVFVAFLALLFWGEWSLLKLEHKRNQAFIAKEDAQRVLYERMLTKLDEMECE